MFEQTRSFSQQNKPLILLLILSALLHIIILRQFSWNSREIKPEERIIEIELLEPPKPVVIKQPTANQYKSEKQQTNASKASSKPSVVEKKEEINTVQEKKEEPKAEPKPKPKPVIEKPTLSVQSNLPYISGGETGSREITVSQKKLQIPEIKRDEKNFDPDLTPVPVTEDPLKEVRRKHRKDETSPAVEDINVNQLVTDDIVKEVDESGKEDPKTVSESGQDEITPVGGGNQREESGFDKGVHLEGEISNRRILFRPNPPKLNLDRDVTVSLRITVLPNGEVDQIIPFQKAEPELERMAIKMLHQYRFEPLFGSNEVQSGIFHFTIQRAE